MIWRDGNESRAAMSIHFRMGSPYLLRFVMGKAEKPICFTYSMMQGDLEKMTE